MLFMDLDVKQLALAEILSLQKLVLNNGRFKEK